MKIHLDNEYMLMQGHTPIRYYYIRLFTVVHQEEMTRRQSYALYRCRTRTIPSLRWDHDLGSVPHSAYEKKEKIK